MDCSVVSWCGIPMEAQAAWVQAIFSIVGIGVAIAIPAAQHMRDRRDRQQQESKEAKALALLLIPTLNVWVENLSRYQLVVQQHLNAHFPGSVDWNSIAEALVLGEQGKLLAPQSHRMGPIAPDAQQFFYFLASAQQSARDSANQRSSGDENSARITAIAELLDRARQAALRAREAAHRLFEAK